MGKKQAWREGSCRRAMRIGRVRLVSTSLTTPNQMAMKKQVIRQPPRGATRSEKKIMFIAAERKRHADLGLEEEKKCLGQELKKVAKEMS